MAHKTIFAWARANNFSNRVPAHKRFLCRRGNENTCSTGSISAAVRAARQWWSSVAAYADRFIPIAQIPYHRDSRLERHRHRRDRAAHATTSDDAAKLVRIKSRHMKDDRCAGCDGFNIDARVCGAIHSFCT